VVTKFRRQAKFSRKDLAAKAGIEYGHIGYIERGEGCPRIETMYAISQSLGITLSEIALAIPGDFTFATPSPVTKKHVNIFKVNRD
jgi:transcriptional regulator with XRE-family HTH domain